MERTAIERLVNVKQLAGYLAVPESWVYGHTAAGDIPMVHVGRYVRFRLSEVLDWLHRDAE